MKGVKLADLTLDRIPSLTDEESEQLWAEADQRRVSWMEYRDGTRAICAVATSHDSDVMVATRICHPDCPASVLEALPGLVRRVTGKTSDEWPDADPVRVSAAGIIELLEFLDDVGADWKFRHLPHACLSAAFAAIVVLGVRDDHHSPRVTEEFEHK